VEGTGAAGTLPGVRPPTAAAVVPGSTIGKYRILRLLGSGGMGLVYEAKHTEMGKAVALKLLSGSRATDARARARFLREAAAASKLTHPHLVNATDYGTDGGVPYLVMELLQGQDLAAHLKRHPAGLPVEETADILLAVCAGVHAAHQAGVIHRDLKPSNVFLADGPLGEVEPKVLDFGISSIEQPPWSAPLTDSDVLLGTTPYMAPEQLTQHEVGPWTDQYALGVVLYESLTGTRPYGGETPYVVMLNVSQGKPLPPSARRPGLPGELEAVVLRAMSAAATARFPSVHALGAALLPFASPRKQVLWGRYFAREGDGGDPSSASKSNPPITLNPIARTSEVSTRKLGAILLRATLLLALVATIGLVLWRQGLLATREPPAPPPVVRVAPPPAAPAAPAAAAPGPPPAAAPAAEPVRPPAPRPVEATGAAKARLTAPARASSTSKRRHRGRRPAPAAETSPAPAPSPPAEPPAPRPFIEP
jgi:serine/threonine protein kinase